MTKSRKISRRKFLRTVGVVSVASIAGTAVPVNLRFAGPHSQKAPEQQGVEHTFFLSNTVCLIVEHDPERLSDEEALVKAQAVVSETFGGLERKRSGETIDTPLTVRGPEGRVATLATYACGYEKQDLLRNVFMTNRALRESDSLS